MIMMHLEPGRYGCPVCDCRFETLREKRRHILFTHGPRPK